MSIAAGCRHKWGVIAKAVDPSTSERDDARFAAMAKAAAENDLMLIGKDAMTSLTETIISLRSENERLQAELAAAPNRAHFELLAEALAEVKATSDGDSEQPIAQIVAGCLAEIAALSEGQST